MRMLDQVAKNIRLDRLDSFGFNVLTRATRDGSNSLLVRLLEVYAQ